MKNIKIIGIKKNFGKFFNRDFKDRIKFKKSNNRITHIKVRLI